MITVMPANSTARPLVSIDSTTASSTLSPSLQALPVAGDDEQGVVDADAEADHRHHRRREVGHRDDVAEQRDEGRGDAEAEQGGADRQAHRQHRTEGQDEDDDGGDDAEISLSGQLELAEQVTAVLDRQALDGRLLLAEVLDLLAEVGDLLEASVGDVELGEGDRAVGADLLRVVVRAGDRHAVLRGGEVDRASSAPPSTSGSSTPCSALTTICAENPARFGVVRLEQLLDVLGLAVGQREVGAVVRADGAGDGVDDDEQGDPGPDDDPAVADAGAGEGGQHGRKRYATVASTSRGLSPDGLDIGHSATPAVHLRQLARARRRCRDRAAPPVRPAAAPVAGRPVRSTVRATAAGGRTTRRRGPSPRRRASRRRRRGRPAPRPPRSARPAGRRRRRRRTPDRCGRRRRARRPPRRRRRTPPAAPPARRGRSR